jgi:hypothetical protein
MAKSGYGFWGRNRTTLFSEEEEKVGKITIKLERRRPMMKRLALLCCILLLPTIVAAAPTPDGNTHYGNFWVGGQSGAVFTLDPNLPVRHQRLIPGFQRGPLPATTSACHTDKSGKGISAWLWTSNGTNSIGIGHTSMLRGTSLLYPSWAGCNTRSWEVKGLPLAGWSHSSWRARPSSGQILAAAGKPIPTLGLLPRLAWNFSWFRMCPLARPSVTVMSLVTQTWTR